MARGTGTSRDSRQIMVRQITMSTNKARLLPSGYQAPISGDLSGAYIKLYDFILSAQEL